MGKTKLEKMMGDIVIQEYTVSDFMQDARSVASAEELQRLEDVADDPMRMNILLSKLQKLPRRNLTLVKNFLRDL